MTRFNTQSTDPRITKNYEGEKAWELGPEMSLYTRVCTSILTPQFYTPDVNDELNRIKSLIKKVDPEFVAKLGVYAREQMYLRSIPLVLAVELAKVHSGNDLLRRMARRVIARADELTEVVAYYLMANGRMKEWRDYQIIDGKKKALPEGQKKFAYKMSKQLIKGIADAFIKFDEYQLKKYEGADKEIKLRDVLFLAHPKPRSAAQAKAFKRLANAELSQANTWETASSAVGQKAKAIAEEKQMTEVEAEKLKKEMQKDMWERKIDTEGKGELGYMAMLRNLMNFLKYEVSMGHIQKVAARLANKDEVLRSKQLPFRFFSAYRMLRGAQSGAVGYLGRGWGYRTSHRSLAAGRKVIEVQNWKIEKSLKDSANPRTGILLEALEEAVKHSCLNIPAFGWDTNVLIAADTSGSMQKPIREIVTDTGKKVHQSVLQCYDIGLALAMMLQYKCKVVSAGMFGDSFAVLPFPKDQILRNVDEMHAQEGIVGYSTNGFLVVQYAIEMAKQRNIVYDKVFMFSDGQLWNSTSDKAHINSEWKKFKQINPKAQLYIFDLAGYGSSPVDLRENDTFMIAGWSEKVFDVIRSLDEGKDALSKIRDIEL